MKKEELVAQMAEEAGITKTQAAKALSAMLQGIAGALKEKDGKVALVGFGTFVKVERKARQGVNPSTGAKIQIKASNVVRFRPGKQLKDDVG
uniref:HU family DNA-binding protein n=1 Tax=Desulfatirhabdium butyrativorans TaxID=340467 RepID=A0A7C4RSN5_9BACT